MKTLRRAHKLVSIVTSILMLVQPILPVLPLIQTPVYAQDLTPTPEPTVDVSPTEESTPTPSPEITPEPSGESTPAPTAETTPTTVPDVTPTVIPTKEATPSQTDQTTTPSSSSTEPPKETGPPSENGQILDGASTTAAPSPTVVPESTEVGVLQAVIVEHVAANSLNLDNVDPSNSATLTTDKADYAPTDTAIISGLGFIAGESYNLTISSDDPPPTSTTVEVTADENGSFVYAYQLDGTYRPNYLVEAKELDGTSVDIVTFTDSDTTFKVPTSTHTPNDWDTNTVTSVQSSDNVYATDNDEDEQGYSNFTFPTIPTGSTINGIELKVEANSSDSSGCRLETRVSWNNGSSNTSIKTASVTDTDAMYIFGGSSDTWGRTWAASEFTDANFVAKVKIDDESGSSCAGGAVASFDHIQVKVYYTESGSSSGVQTAIGQCVQEAYGANVQCTAGDVSIANVTGIQILDDGCTSPSDTVTFKATWNVQSTATERYNIGLYFASEGQTSAVTGTCAVSTLANSPVPPNYNFDGNACGDISSASSVNPEITMTVQCKDPDGDNSLNLPYCTSWNQNIGENLSCSAPSGAIPGAPSKCNCQDGYEVPVTVPHFAKIEVKKSLVPTNDAGTFNLQVDGTNGASCVGNNGTTGTVNVPAGTSASPGATHTVGETTCSGTSSSNYTSSISCVDRGLTTFNGSAALTQSGMGPLNVPVTKDDDVVCTVTNTRINNASLTIVKDAVPNDPQDFSFTASGSGLSNFSLDDDSDSTVSNTITFNSLAAGTYTVSEAVVSGWSQTSAVCNDGSPTNAINLSAGENVTCTFTNTLQNGHLIVQKTTVPSGDLTSFPIIATGSGTIVNTASGTVTDSTDYDYEVTPGNYWVTETVPSGWSKTGDTCQNVTVPAGQTVYCQLTNTKLGKIVVEKQTLPNGSGQSFSFNPSYGSTFALSDGQQNDSGFTLLPGSYSVSETVPAGWDLTGSVCTSSLQDTETAGSLDLDAGETIICIFTNTQRGSITVEKQTAPDAASGNFTFTGTASGTISDNGQITVSNLVPGQYTSTESDPTPGFDVTGISCNDTTNGGQASTGDTATRSATFNLDPGEAVTCTFTNTQRGSISGTKYDDADGNNSTTNDRTVLSGWVMELWKWVTDAFTNTGLTDTTDVNGAYSFENVVPGLYQVREQMKAGWTNVTPTAISVTLLAAESDTGNNFVNTKYGTIIVVKQTLPGGSQEMFDFDLSFGDGDADLSDGQQDSTGNLLPGTYSVSENTPAGWDITSATCSDNSNPSSISLQSGETVTCTFTNTKRGHLIVQKTTIPSGDTNVFNITATGSGIIIGGGSGTVTDASDKNYEVTPGTYSVSETVPGNWDLTGNTCVNVTVAAGETKTCELTNTKRGHVTVIKYHDHNANGVKDAGDEVLGETGTGAEIEASRWEMHLVGTNVNAYQWTGAQVTGQVTFSDLAPNTYTLSEQIKNGWLQSNIACGDETTRDNDNSHPVTVVSGQTTTCYVGNFQPGHIVVDKVTLPEGSAQSFDFTATGSGYTNFSLSDQATPNDQTVTPGSYAVSETVPSGWDQTGLSCASSLNDTEEADTLTVQSGETITCTFTNTQRGSIAGRKYDDTNGNGSRGGSEPYLNGWAIHLFDTSWAQLDQMNTGDTGTTGQYKFTNLVPGTYYVCEDLQTGWSQSQPASGVTRNDTYCRSITVSSGENVTGQHFGNIQLGVIQSRKYEDVNGNSVHNDGESWLDGWTIRLYKQGEGWESVDNKVTGHTGTEGQYRFEDLSFGTYFICEVLQDGWAETDPSSSEGYANLSGEGDEAGRCRRFIVDSSGDESLSEKHFGNQGQGTIIVEKDVVPESGAAFTFSIQGDYIETIGFVLGDGQSTDPDYSGLPAGTYVVSETPDDLYTTDVECVSSDDDTEIASALDLDPGETITCTFTNTRKTGDLLVHKMVRSGVSGDFVSADPGDFVWGTSEGVTPFAMGSSKTFDTGEYSVYENTVTNYHPVGWYYTDDEGSCEEPEYTQLPASVTVTYDQTTEITLCNTRDTGTITVDKVTDPDEADQEFTIRVSDEETNLYDYLLQDGDSETKEFVTGSYSLDELDVLGWDLTGARCTTNKGEPFAYTEGELLELGYGDNISCTFTNTKRGTVIVTKYNDENGNGTRDDGEGVLSDWTMNLTSKGTVQQTTDENGEATFENMLPDTYSLSENLKDGWEQTELRCEEIRQEQFADDSADTLGPPPGQFKLNPGETQYCVVGNRQLNPIVTISKYNDASGVKSPGDNVLFTITVTATQSAAFNVFVTDLPSNGFTYRANSWTASSTVRGDLKALGITTQPTYASPGVWNLGDMEKDETVTLTYVADISTDQKPGIYKDLAWAHGCRFETNCAVGDANSILSNAVNPGFVDDNFVGTLVEITKDLQSGAKLNKSEGEVLGASTELPATGADELWIKLAALFFLVGLGFIAAGKYARRFYV